MMRLYWSQCLGDLHRHVRGSGDVSHEIDTFHRINSLYRTHPYINLPTEGSQSGFVKPGNSLRQMSHGTHQELNLQRKRENSPGYGTQAKSPFTIGVLFSYRQGTHQGE